MAAVQLIIAQAGPLPIKVSTGIGSDGPSVLTLVGSAWSMSANQLIGVSLSIDGEPVGNAQIFSNGASTHRAVIPMTLAYTFTYGPHTFELTAMNPQTTTDLNDFFRLTVQY